MQGLLQEGGHAIQVVFIFTRGKSPGHLFLTCSRYDALYGPIVGPHYGLRIAIARKWHSIGFHWSFSHVIMGKCDLCLCVLVSLSGQRTRDRVNNQ